MTEFDPLRAAREEASAMVDVLTTMRRREQTAEAAIGAAESELNSIRKLRGYAEIELGRIRHRITVLEQEKEGK